MLSMGLIYCTVAQKFRRMIDCDNTTHGTNSRPPSVFLLYDNDKKSLGLTDKSD